MKHKLLLTLAFALIFLSVGAAQAASPIWIKVTSNGNDITQGKVVSVPLNTNANVTVYYYDKGKPAAAILEVWYRTKTNLPWMIISIPFADLIGSDGKAFKESFFYTLKNPGYYKFVWAVQNRPCSFKTVCTVVGPVLPEPSTFAGLAASLTALGVVLLKKRAH